MRPERDTRTGAHESELCREIPLRSKPEGWNPAGPGPLTAYFLLLSMLVLLRKNRCREEPGQAADDAVTLLFLNLQTGAAFSQVQPNARCWRIA